MGQRHGVAASPLGPRLSLARGNQRTNVCCSDVCPQQEGHPPDTGTNTDYRVRPAWGPISPDPPGPHQHPGAMGPPLSRGLKRVERPLFSETGDTHQSFGVSQTKTKVGGQVLGPHPGPCWLDRSAPGAGLALVLLAEGTLLPLSHPNTTHHLSPRKSEDLCCSAPSVLTSLLLYGR